MMKKQLYFLFLLLLSVQLAIAQTARYEYWLDNDHDDRTVVADNVDAVSLDLDISSMMPGLHYFNFRTQDKSGQWGGLSRYLFFIRENADANAAFMTKYEYWLDNNCDERTVVNGETTDVLLDLDISQLSPGLHFFNIRAQGKSGQWGGLSRYLFFMRAEADATASSMSKYEYWLDNNYGERTIVDGSAEDVPLNLDISHLNPGLHYFNVRAQGKNGQWGGLSRYLFFVKQGDLGNLANIEYWIDNRQEVTTQQVTDSTVVITMDISNLAGGKHTFYMEGMTSKGARCLLNGYEFNVDFASEPEPYAVLSQDSTVLTFYYDDKKDSFKDAMSVGPFETLPSVVWKDYRESITTVVFDSTFVDCTTLTSTANWFAYCSNLKTINGLSYLKTDSVTNMNHMFYRCSGLRDLDLTTFNTANVTDMSSFIEGCSGLLAIDMTSFNTENVINMGWMFGGCSSLPVFNLVSFNTDKVTDMRYMFSQCENLKTIYVGDGWSTKSVTESVSMFSDCYVLVGAAGTVYNENNTDVTYAHIDGGSSNPGYFTDKNAAEVPDTVETPTFEFEYIWDNYLTIKTETEDAEIYYTMNGRMLEREDANFGYNTLGRYGNWKAWGDNLQEAKSEYNEDVYSGYYGSNYVLKLTSRVDSVMESAQLGYRFNTALTKNDYYTVHFQARSVSGNGQIQFFCQNDTLTTKYRSAADTMAIGKEWADYEYTVKIDNDSTNQIVLNFGGVADTYYIDNVLFGPVISDTINGNLRTRYENPIEMRDNVTITAVAVKDGMAESKTAIYDYFYEGWIMLRDTYEKGRMVLEVCYGDPNVPLQDVDAMRARLEDMLYSYYERRTEKRFDDNELLYAADDMMARVDPIYQMKQGFVIDGVAYHAVDSTQVEVRKPLGYYSDGYKGAIVIAPEVFFNNINFRVTSVTEDAFANSELGAIVWNAEFTVPDNVNTMVNNPNLLVYVNSDALAPRNITNVVINGVAKNIILVDATTENGSFLVPESFTAEQISYERTFNQETMVGVCRGWESIALPFDVQTITHEKQGAISPFGRGDSNKHFWLRRLGSNGFVQADKIEANVPYIIAMPNSSEYSEQYNLPGRVTFSATNAIVPITEERVLSLSDSTIMMMPTMQRLGRSSRYYAINVGEVRGQYLEGSVFERDYREIRPFEAYTTHAENAPAPRFVPIDDIIGGNMTGIEDVRNQMSDGRSDIWYDLNGRRLQKEPAQKGVYLRNGRKVIIR